MFIPPMACKKVGNLDISKDVLEGYDTVSIMCIGLRDTRTFLK